MCNLLIVCLTGGTVFEYLQQRNGQLLEEEVTAPLLLMYKIVFYLLHAVFDVHRLQYEILNI